MTPVAKAGSRIVDCLGKAAALTCMGMVATFLPLQAQALTYTFVDAAFSFTSGIISGSGTISGSFDYDGTANSSSNITNFSSIEVSPWQFNGPSTPVFAGYTGTTASSGNLGFTGNQGSSSSTQREFFLIRNVRLTNTQETISLISLNSGNDGEIGFCLNNGCPRALYRDVSFQFTGGVLTSVPLPLSPVALTPLALAMARIRKRCLTPSLR